MLAMADLQIMLQSLFVLIHDWEEMNNSLKKFGVGQPVSLRQGFLEALYFFLRRKRLDFCNYMVIMFSNVYTLAEWEHKNKST